MVEQMKKFTVSTAYTLIGKYRQLSSPVDHCDFASQVAWQGTKFSGSEFQIRNPIDPVERASTTLHTR